MIPFSISVGGRGGNRTDIDGLLITTCINKLTVVTSYQTWWLKTNLFSLVLEARNSKSRCQPGHTPSEPLGESLFLLLPAPGDSRCSLACGYITPISASVFTWPSVSQFPLVSLIRTPVIGVRAHPKSRIISSKYSQLHLQGSYFQIRSHSQVLGVGTLTYLLVGGALFNLLYNPFAENMEIYRHLELRISGYENLE